MPREAKGQVRKLADGYEARVTIGPKQRKGFALLGCHNDAEADERTRLMADMAKRLCKAGEPDAVKGLLEMAAVATTADKLDNVRRAVDTICRGESRLSGAGGDSTFKDFADLWTSGKLHKDYPDYVKEKKSVDDDKARLKRICDVVGTVPIARFTVRHAEAVMRSLPAEFSAGTRRQYAQALHRVLGLAVYPAKLITANPLPRGFLPSPGPAKALTCLYPDEDAKLMAANAETVPLCYRVLYGFLAREGCRAGEAQMLRWSDLDLGRGAITLDENKTDDPRSWALDPGVVRALTVWKDTREDTDPTDPVFVDEYDRPMQVDGLAERFREEHLRAAGVDRAALYERGPNRRPIRAHDLRATFITVSLANGKTEAWVMNERGTRRRPC